MLFKNRKGQNTAEYAILIGLVVAAVIAMQTYVKRGLQGRIEEAAKASPKIETASGSEALPFKIPQGDKRTVAFQKGPQYEPYYLESVFRSSRDAISDDKTVVGSAVLRKTDEHTVRRGYQGNEALGSLEIEGDKIILRGSKAKDEVIYKD